MNTINYRKGKRQEIIKLLHYCGSIPYSAINHLEESKTSRMYHAVINKMQKEEVVEIVKKNGEKQLILTDYENKSPLYTKAIASDYQDYYINIAITSRRVALNFNKSDAGKILRVNELILYMYSLGYATLPDQKENIVRCKEITTTPTTFYTSKEIKRGTNYKDLVEMEDTNKTIIASRIDGLLISDGGIYPTYNLRNQNYLWKPQGELRIKLYIERLINNKHPDYIQSKGFVCKDTILFAKKIMLFSKMLSENAKNDSFKKMIGLGSLYTNIYALTSDTNGKKMLQIMTQKNWKQNMLQDLLPNDFIEEGVYTTVSCDGFDKENGIYKLLFCIPNLAKLYMFAMRAKIENKPTQFEVYCFTHQIPLVVALTEKKAKIKEVSLDDYYKYLFVEDENGENKDV